MRGHTFQIRNVKFCGLQQVPFAAHIKINQAVHGTVGSNYGRGKRSVLAVVSEFRPVFVAGRSRPADGKWQGNALAGGILGFRQKHSVGNIVGGERNQFLTIFFAEDQHQSNALQVDLHTLVGVIAKCHVKSDNSAIERRFLGEFLFIVRCPSPRFDADGYALMRFNCRSNELGPFAARSRRRVIGDQGE